MHSLTPLSQPTKGKPNVRLAVITIVALHAVFFGGLLLQGCGKKTGGETAGGSGAAGTGVDYGSLTNMPYGDLTNGLAGATSTQAVTDPYAVLPALSNQTSAAQPIQSSQGLQPLSPAGTAGLGNLPPAAPVAPAGSDYAVARGDTLAKIAKDHGVTLAALTKANPGVDPKKLKVGQKLTVPSNAVQAGAEKAADANAGDGTNSYTVKGGDNLTKIAQKYGVSVKEIRTANSLKTDRLHVGQKLRIPAGKKSAPASTPAPAAGGAVGA